MGRELPSSDMHLEGRTYERVWFWELGAVTSGVRGGHPEGYCIRAREVWEL